MIDERGEVLLPYAGTSGWSGSATSYDRAVTADREGTTGARQRQTLAHLARAGERGCTWQELAAATGWHHGTASGVLSVLHKEGRIARLAESRNRCRVYVLDTYAEGREVEEHGRKRHACPNCGWQAP